MCGLTLPGWTARVEVALEYFQIPYAVNSQPAPSPLGEDVD
jgi:hypothetical protein